MFGFVFLFQVRVVDVLLDDSDGFIKPGDIATESFDLDPSEPLAAILCRLAKWRQVTRAQKQREEVKRPTKKFGRLLDANTCGPVRLIL